MAALFDWFIGLLKRLFLLSEMVIFLVPPSQQVD